MAGLLSASHIIKGSLVSLAKSEMLAGLGGAAKWKSNMLEKASALFSSRGADLQSYIYSSSALADSQKAKQVLHIPLFDFTSLRIPHMRCALAQIRTDALVKSRHGQVL